MKNNIVYLAVLMGFLTSFSVSAYDSAYVHIDRNDVVEITGKLTSINWRNPHTEFVQRVANESGEEALWLGQERGASLLVSKNVT